VSVRAWRRLSADDRRLLIEAAALVVAARIALALLPFRAVHRLAVRAAHLSSRRRPSPARERATWAVRAAASRVPGTACLPEALSAYALMSRHGHPTRLCIGVRRPEGGSELDAHAWVEDDASPAPRGDGDDFARLPLEVLER
jgi:hypothetical protein